MIEIYFTIGAIIGLLYHFIDADTFWQSINVLNLAVCMLLGMFIWPVLFLKR